jgi:hypothetical protein
LSKTDVSTAINIICKDFASMNARHSSGVHGHRRHNNDRENRNTPRSSGKPYNDSLSDRIKAREQLKLTQKQLDLIWGESPNEISSSDSDDDGKKRKHSRKKKRKVSSSDSDSDDHKRKKRKRKHDNHREKKSEPKSQDISDDEFDTYARVPQVDTDFGPQQLPTVKADVKYSSDMLPGEASAIAKYVQENKRIPRRGEVGLSSDDIERFETLGYVMSGSRNQMMNAVRLRKENQVITAEERKRMTQLAIEEKTKKENKIIQQFREMVKNE